MHTRSNHWQWSLTGNICQVACRQFLLSASNLMVLSSSPLPSERNQTKSLGKLRFPRFLLGLSLRWSKRLAQVTWIKFSSFKSPPRNLSITMIHEHLCNIKTELNCDLRAESWFFASLLKGPLFCFLLFVCFRSSNFVQWVAWASWNKMNRHYDDTWGFKV